jgi:hypothetical protein
MASRPNTRKESASPKGTSPREPAPQAAAKPGWNPLPFLERNSLYLLIALLILGGIRIMSTYSVFSYTFDEPAHLACGMEWLDKGVYTWEPQHPPLSRVAVSLGPYLAGIRSQNTPRVDYTSMFQEGYSILYNGGRADEALWLARLGNLPFYLVGCLVVYFWARRYAGRGIAILAAFLFSFLPPVLAHGGMATTDMACTACLTAAFFAATVWMEEPSLRTGSLFGLAGALAICSKYSVLPYFAVAAVFALVGYWLIERPKIVLGIEIRRRLPSLALAGAVAFVVIWAIFRFSFGKVYFADIKLPAPELFAGIREVMNHNEKGHPGYLLGKMSNNGFWYFYPVDLAVKTPLALLVLFGIGAWIWRTPLMRRAWLPIAFSGGVLAVAMFSHINIGIRHVLPIYSGLSITAAVGLAHLMQSSAARRWTGWAAIALAGWYAVASIACHPDYLPYFNELAGSHPENISVDSDLDWGQDMKRLSARLREVGAREVNLLPMSVGDVQKQFNLPPISAGMDALNPSPGWSAVSLTVLKQRRLGMRDRYPDLQPWPERFGGYEMVGKSFRLYHFQER